ncbi:MAG: hypothetical protein ACJAUV_000699 [Flavobacteriales bacterium]|jgi:uncharacterized protein
MEKVLKEFLVRFGSLSQGRHTFEFEVTDKFFACFEFSEVEKGNINVAVELEKQSTMLIFHFNFTGKLQLNCDRCAGEYLQDIDVTERLIVKFGNEVYDISDEIMIIPHGEYELNVSKWVYEFLTLNIPHQRLHPEGECDEDVLDFIEEGEFPDEDQDIEEPIDPRWEALQQLKNKK